MQRPELHERPLRGNADVQGRRSDVLRDHALLCRVVVLRWNVRDTAAGVPELRPVVRGDLGLLLGPQLHQWRVHRSAGVPELGSNLCLERVVLFGADLYRRSMRHDADVRRLRSELCLERRLLLGADVQRRSLWRCRGLSSPWPGVFSHVALLQRRALLRGVSGHVLQNELRPARRRSRHHC